MKNLLAGALLLLNFSAFSQSDLNEKPAEKLVTFSSVLIDYTIHKNKLVALTKKNREYFIYYTDSTGAGLHDAIEIFFPIKLEIDCMGNLFIVGLDSAFQLSVGNYVKKVHAFDRATYNSTIQNCRAYFDTTLVRTGPENSLIYEPIDDEAFTKNPELAVIQMLKSRMYDPNGAFNKNTYERRSLADNTPSSFLYDQYAKPPTKRRSRGTYTSNYNQTGEIASLLFGFQCGDSLWVINETDSYLSIYSQAGVCSHFVPTQKDSYYIDIEQDRSNGTIYYLTRSLTKTLIEKLNRDGSLTIIGEINKGGTISDLKIGNGYVYYRNSKGTGESLYRIKLD